MNGIYFEIIGLVLGLIGAISSLWFFWEKIFPKRRLSWKSAEKAARKIADETVSDNFSPTLIVGIGRGGAIMGALISGALGHRPLIVIDRKYEWRKGDRFEDMVFPVSIPQSFLEKVLLVSGEVHSGKTMRVYHEYFEEIGSKSIRRGTFYLEKGAPIRVEHRGLELAKKDILMPWMFTSRYIRADRGPPEISKA